MAICSDRLSKKKEETLVDPPSNLEVRDYSCVQPSWATPPCRAECSSVPPRDRLFQASHGLEGLPSGDSQTICADEMLFEGVSGIYSWPRKILEWREMIIIVCGSIPQQISSQTFIYFFIIISLPNVTGARWKREEESTLRHTWENERVHIQACDDNRL